jgi:hypothetical protein
MSWNGETDEPTDVFGFAPSVRARMTERDDPETSLTMIADATTRIADSLDRLVGALERIARGDGS